MDVVHPPVTTAGDDRPELPLDASPGWRRDARRAGPARRRARDARPAAAFAAGGQASPPAQPPAAAGAARPNPTGSRRRRRARRGSRRRCSAPASTSCAWTSSCLTSRATPVSDLAQADFEVFEDNKPQTVETFKLVTVDWQPATRRRRPAGDPLRLRRGVRGAARGRPHLRLRARRLPRAPGNQHGRAAAPRSTSSARNSGRWISSA